RTAASSRPSAGRAAGSCRSGPPPPSPPSSSACSPAAAPAPRRPSAPSPPPTPTPHGRGYLPGAYVASFIGFAPADHPAVAVAVVLDQPTPIFGGVVAAPSLRGGIRHALTRLRARRS